MGNAAHAIHPIGAQGFNLGLRDVAVLAEVLSEAIQQEKDIGSDAVLSRYSVMANSRSVRNCGLVRRTGPYICQPDRVGRGGSNYWNDGAYDFSITASPHGRQGDGVSRSYSPSGPWPGATGEKIVSVHQVDIVIVGGGMVGLAAAGLLSRAGFTVALVESAKPAAFDNDSEPGLRVSALSPGSIRILSQTGAWRQIEQNRHCAHADMHVEELVSSDSDDLSVLDFSAGEFALDCLGAIVENDLVQWALWQSLEALGTVGLFCPDKLDSFEADESRVSVRLQSGATLECMLLVGADGSGSRVRKSLGIPQTEWVYAQKGLVSVVECEQKNPGTAWQRFVNGHPLAFLPLEDGRSSIVWTLPEAEADRMLAVDDESFRFQLGEACGSLAW